MRILSYIKHEGRYAYAKVEEKGTKQYVPVIKAGGAPRLARKVRCKRASEALEYHIRSAELHNKRHNHKGVHP